MGSVFGVPWQVDLVGLGSPMPIGGTRPFSSTCSALGVQRIAVFGVVIRLEAIAIVALLVWNRSVFGVAFFR